MKKICNVNTKIRPLYWSFRRKQCEKIQNLYPKKGRGRLQEVLVYYKALSGKILVFWIGGGRLQEMVAQGGSTLLFSLLCTYIASQL